MPHSAEQRRLANLNLRPYKAGEEWHGNPGGLPGTVREAKHFCQARTLEGVERLYELMHSRDDRVAVVAVEGFLNRAIGKAKEAEPEQPDKPLLDVSILTAAERSLLRDLLLSAARRRGESTIEEAPADAETTEPEAEVLPPEAAE